jgi:hypothetical protein
LEFFRSLFSPAACGEVKSCRPEGRLYENHLRPRDVLQADHDEPSIPIRPFGRSIPKNRNSAPAGPQCSAVNFPSSISGSDLRLGSAVRICG